MTNRTPDATHTRDAHMRMSLMDVLTLQRRWPPPCELAPTHGLEVRELPPLRPAPPPAGLSPAWMRAQPWWNAGTGKAPDHWYADVPRPDLSPVPGERPTVTELGLERRLPGCTPAVCGLCSAPDTTHRATYRHLGGRLVARQVCGACIVSLRSGRLPGEPWQPLTGRAALGHYSVAAECAAPDEDAEAYLGITHDGPAEDESDGVEVRHTPISVTGRVFITQEAHPRMLCGVCVMHPVTHAVHCSVWASGEERRFALHVCELHAQEAEAAAWRRIRA